MFQKEKQHLGLLQKLIIVINAYSLILDSTEKAVESSLASTGHATTRDRYMDVQNYVFHMACNVCKDVCIRHGSTFNSGYLRVC
ncbi:hypothetical protein L3X38_002653 [Prunus dulcis]|uniref:Uncharacterized protein n=1 Tax=Prunus dulcis TaxID=3755 RepID=A0AAD4ZKZ3_PRUDU|nr:hypothetical protein L3X38_002653 [Prunus dulcis]